MDVWGRAKQIVADTFFGDTVYVYEVAFQSNSLNEQLETVQLVGEYNCNIQNAQSTVSRNEAGAGVPQALRISMAKEVPLSYSKVYKIKIKSARVAFDPNEFWNVDGWTEAQISNVLSVSRGVAV